MPKLVPCPNGRSCGSAQHDIGSAQLQKCQKAVSRRPGIINVEGRDVSSASLMLDVPGGVECYNVHRKDGSRKIGFKGLTQRYQTGGFSDTLARYVAMRGNAEKLLVELVNDLAPRLAPFEKNGEVRVIFSEGQTLSDPGSRERFIQRHNNEALFSKIKRYARDWEDVVELLEGDDLGQGVGYSMTLVDSEGNVTSAAVTLHMILSITHPDGWNRTTTLLNAHNNERGQDELIGILMEDDKNQVISRFASSCGLGDDEGRWAIFHEIMAYSTDWTEPDSDMFEPGDWRFPLSEYGQEVVAKACEKALAS